MESARPLNMQMRPSGPVGRWPKPKGNVMLSAIQLIIHEPWNISAAVPDAKTVSTFRLAISSSGVLNPSTRPRSASDWIDWITRSSSK